MVIISKNVLSVTVIMTCFLLVPDRLVYAFQKYFTRTFKHLNLDSMMQIYNHSLIGCFVGGYILFLWKVRGEWSDWLELIGSLY